MNLRMSFELIGPRKLLGTAWLSALEWLFACVWIEGISGCL
jgi:hypothetical protein